MRRIKLIIIIALCAIALVIIVAYVIKSDCDSSQNCTMNHSLIVNNSTEVITVINASNVTISLPSKETVDNSINWSQYSHIGYHNIHELRIAGPNSVINHTFLLIYWKIEIIEPDDTLVIFNEMANVIKQERATLGQNSGIELLGEYNGVVVYSAGLLPYSSTIYLEDYYHPVNDLTWSQTDMGDIEFKIKSRPREQGVE